MSGSNANLPDHFLQANGQFEPLVSIIIPAYNHGAYLDDAINSILGQSYSNLEIIVVDDGSTDETKAVAASFGDKIQYIWQHNRGLCAARNSGLEAATGTYIGLLDADDILEPEYCSWLVSSLLAFPDAQGIVCGYRFVDQHNQSLPQVESRCLTANDLYSNLLDGNFLVPESILVHRRCYEGAGLFDVKLTACEDWDMWLRIAKANKIICTERVLTRHRILPASMSSDPVRMLTNRLAVLEKHVGPEPTDGTDTLLLRRAYGYAYFTSSMEYKQIDDDEQAMKYLRRATSIYPEILTHIDTFYELGCSYQIKGYRGYLEALDIDKSAQSVADVLHIFVMSNQRPNSLAGKEREICAIAFWALSLLAYGAGDSRRARQFLRKVLTNSPSFILKQDYLGLLARSIIGEAGITQAKKMSARLSFAMNPEKQITRA